MANCKRLDLKQTINLCEWLKNNKESLIDLNYPQIADLASTDLLVSMSPSSVRACCLELGIKPMEKVLSLNTKTLSGMINFLADRLMKLDSKQLGFSITVDERYRSIIALTTFKRDKVNDNS
jgi:hypothetical protein